MTRERRRRRNVECQAYRISAERRRRLPRHQMWADVAVLPSDSANVKAEAQELLEMPYVRSVAVLEVTGEYHEREKRLHYVAGDPSLEIIYKESGLQFRLDLARRLSRLSRSQGGPAERRRICQQVAEGERILVLGAGFGLTACILGARAPCREVVGVERNAVAHEFAVANIEANRLCGMVSSIRRDPTELDGLGTFDRVSAFLPFHKDGSLIPLAANVKPSLSVLDPGGILHCYTFETEEEFAGEGVELAKHEMAEACGGRAFELLWRDKVPHKSIGPNGYRVGMDFRVE